MYRPLIASLPNSEWTDWSFQVYELFEVRRGHGNFALQVADQTGMVLVIYAGKEYRFNLDREEALKIVELAHQILQNDVYVSRSILTFGAESLKLEFFKHYSGEYAALHLDRFLQIGAAESHVELPQTTFRMTEIRNLQDRLQQYWKIFSAPKLGERINDALRNRWPHASFWGMTRQAAYALLALVKIPDDYEMDNDETIVVANDGYKTWMAVHMHDGQYAILTRKF